MFLINLGFIRTCIPLAPSMSWCIQVLVILEVFVKVNVFVVGLTFRISLTHGREMSQHIPSRSL